MPQTQRLFSVKKTLLFLLMLGALLGSTPNAFAQNASKVTVIDNASPELLETLLERLDVPYKKISSGEYAFTIQNYKVLLLSKGRDIQLFCSFQGKSISLNRINEWNKSKRFSRAYLDDNGRAIIESDLDFEGGVTAETLLRFLALYSKSVENFAEHLR